MGPLSTDKTSLEPKAQSKRIRVKASSDRLSATITVTDSSDSGQNLTEGDLRQAIQGAGVTTGIEDAVIARIVAEGKTDGPARVAEGTPPVDGNKAELEYFFDVKPDHKPETTDEGIIDYHEMNYIQAVVEGQMLVKKTPATVGTEGTGVDGKPVSASTGADRRLDGGANTRRSEDGLELVATTRGVVLFAGGQVSVRDSVMINGDVDFATGNIHAPCSVKIKGSVRAGFKVDSEGDIEVGGGVEDAELLAEGNITVKGGFSGRGEGLIKAGGDVKIKHVEAQRVIAGGSVWIEEEANNAHIEAGDSVIMRSAQGVIHGGEIVADKYIEAANLGSDLWTPTLLRVSGADDLLQKIHELDEEKERLSADEGRIKEALYGLVRLQMDRQLPSDKKAVLKKLRGVSREIPASIEEIEKRQGKLKAKMMDVENAQIVGTVLIHQGVKTQFGKVYLEVSEERGPTSFCCVSGRVVMDRYDPKEKSK